MPIFVRSYHCNGKALMVTYTKCQKKNKKYYDEQEEKEEKKRNLVDITVCCTCSYVINESYFLFHLHTIRYLITNYNEIHNF